MRERRGRREAIADVGYEDWPEMHSYVHGLSSGAASAGSRSAAARTGWAAEPASSTIWSTGCASRPTWPSGDRLLITDAGSYDHSMAFTFARGGGKHRTLAD